MWSHTFLSGCVIVQVALHSVLELSRSVFHGWLEPDFTLPLNETALWKFYAQWCFCPKVSCTLCWTSNIEHWTLGIKHLAFHIFDAMLNINIEHWTMFMLHWTLDIVHAALNIWFHIIFRWLPTGSGNGPQEAKIVRGDSFRIECPPHIFSLLTEKDTDLTNCESSLCICQATNPA